MADATATTTAETTEEWIDLCDWDEVPTDTGHYVAVGQRGLAVFREGEQPRVMDNACPHAGAALAGGFVQQGRVMCPWHGWEFHLHNGACTDAPTIQVPTYPARVHVGRVQIRLD